MVKQEMGEELMAYRCDQLQKFCCWRESVVTVQSLQEPYINTTL